MSVETANDRIALPPEQRLRLRSAAGACPS